jgi:hypothetical protein
MKLLSPEETGQRLGGISTNSLRDKRYRLRIGLPAVKVGRRLGFREEDVERLITRGREKVLCGGAANERQQ